MATRYVLVIQIEGRLIRQDFSSLAALEIRYGAPVSYVNRRGLRPELQGQPQFASLVGPMWDGTNDAGEPLVRYEDSAAHDQLSA